MGAELWRELLQSSLASSLALIVVLLARRPLRLGLGARIAYGAWIVVPATVLAVLVPAPSKSFVLVADAVTGIGMPQAVLSPMIATPGLGPQALLLAIWSIGAAIAFALFALRQQRFNRLVLRRAKLPYDEVIGHGPAVAGLFRPRIVMPTDFRQRYNVEEQALVLAHERLHLQRGDIHAQSIATALRCLFWFNPLVHYAALRFRFDQELACDASVLERFPNARRSYGEAMLKTQLADFGLPVGCHWQSSHPLKERIAMLKQPLPGVQRRVSGLLLIAAMVATGSYTAWAAQPGASAASKAPAKPSIPLLTAITDADTLTSPTYPPDALTKRLSGKVVLQVLVGVDGAVKEVKVVSSTPAGVFDQVSIEAASKWHFTPASRTSTGEKVEGWVQVPVQFELDPIAKVANP